MGAVKEALYETIEAAFLEPKTEIHGEPVLVALDMFNCFIGMIAGDDEIMRSIEHELFSTYGIDAADFMTDWLGGFTAAYAVLSGLATTEEGCVGNYFDMLAYQYHHQPRHVGRALQRFGFTEATCQGIVYLLAGRLLDASSALRIVKFDYLTK